MAQVDERGREDGQSHSGMYRVGGTGHIHAGVSVAKENKSTRNWLQF